MGGWVGGKYEAERRREVARAVAKVQYILTGASGIHRGEFRPGSMGVGGRRGNAGNLGGAFGVEGTGLCLRVQEMRGREREMERGKEEWVAGGRERVWVRREGVE